MERLFGIERIAGFRFVAVVAALYFIHIGIAMMTGLAIDILESGMCLVSKRDRTQLRGDVYHLLVGRYLGIVGPDAATCQQNSYG
jgi:hypothetical protein